MILLRLRDVSIQILCKNGDSRWLRLDILTTDNKASIKLNEKFGFESDGYIYRNKRNKEVYIFAKSI